MARKKIRRLANLITDALITIVYYYRFTYPTYYLIYICAAIVLAGKII